MRTREIKLYGSWQTEPYQVMTTRATGAPPSPPSAALFHPMSHLLQVGEVVDGVLPINEHGNIEVWEGLRQFVPRGAVFVGSSLAIKAAKMFGLHYVPAVVGFEQRGMHTVPRIGGAVVLQKDQAVLEDAIYQLRAIAQEKELSERYQRVVEKWRKITRSVLSRQRLRETYGS